MKNTLIVISMLTACWTASAAQSNVFECQGYTLYVMDSTGRLRLQNSNVPGAFTELLASGPTEGALTKYILVSGRIIPVGQSSDSHIEVKVEAKLLEGSPTGKIYVRFLDDRGQEQLKRYRCVPLKAL